MPGQTPILTPPPADYDPGSGTCEEGVGYCDPVYLSGFFGGDMNKGSKASIICNRESGGNPSALNDNCLTGITADYSIGLFQINLLAHGVGSLDCPSAFACYSLNPPACQVEEGQEDLLELCANELWDPIVNIQKMVEVSSWGTDWSAWSAAAVCGIQ